MNDRYEMRKNERRKIPKTIDVLRPILSKAQPAANIYEKVAIPNM